MLELNFYSYLFGGLVAICAAVQFYLRSNQKASSSSDEGDGKKEAEEIKKEGENEALFKRFQFNYLLVYFIVMEADWLQGPYVYALYEAYGFDKEEIAILFIAGFTSSMLFGTFIGSVADKYGRRNMCMFFGVAYSFSCITKLFPDFNTLLIGRLLAGIATSLLFSSFESWMVFEHFKRGYTAEQLSSTFSLATFGNGVVAIIAGLLASAVADRWGFVAPFMLALFFLVLATAIVALTWTENYGDATINVTQTFSNAIDILKKDVKIPVLGAVQSLFEASMYVFVFMWTPTLTEDPDAPLAALPYGVIFACYMVCIMIGSSVFSILVQQYRFKLERLATILLVLAFCSLSMPIFSVKQTLVLFAFLSFEVCCGIYFPCFGTLRGMFIPESARATIMNFFRVPLNFFVVVVLLKVKALETKMVFGICGIWLLAALLLARVFNTLARNSASAAERAAHLKEDRDLLVSPADDSTSTSINVAQGDAEPVSM